MFQVLVRLQYFYATTWDICALQVIATQRTWLRSGSSQLSAIYVRFQVRHLACVEFQEASLPPGYHPKLCSRYFSMQNLDFVQQTFDKISLDQEQPVQVPVMSRKDAHRTWFPGIERIREQSRLNRSVVWPAAIPTLRGAWGSRVLKSAMLSNLSSYDCFHFFPVTVTVTVGAYFTYKGLCSNQWPSGSRYGFVYARGHERPAQKGTLFGSKTPCASAPTVEQRCAESRLR